MHSVTFFFRYSGNVWNRVSIAKQTRFSLSLYANVLVISRPTTLARKISPREIFLCALCFAMGVMYDPLELTLARYISPASWKISQRADISGLTHTLTAGDRCQCVYAFAVIRYMISAENFPLSYDIWTTYWLFQSRCLISQPRSYHFTVIMCAVNFKPLSFS